MKTKTSTTQVFFFLNLCVPLLASASLYFQPISLPDLAYLSDTTKITFNGGNSHNCDAILDNTLTASFSSGSSWAPAVAYSTFSSWSSPPYSETNTPDQVLFSHSPSVPGRKLYIRFSKPLQIFGVEIEVELWNVTSPVTAIFYNGAIAVGSITQTIGGFEGARLFAARTETASFDSVVIYDPSSPTGYGIGQFRYALVPPVLPPTIACSQPLILECANGSAIGTVTAGVQDLRDYPLQVVWKVDGVPYQTNDIAQGGALAVTNVTFTANFSTGVHTVDVSASNGQTNPATCSISVTVADTTPPVISCPADIIVPANAGCEATNVNLGLPVASDNCGVATVLSTVPRSFRLGTNFVTWVATDYSGSNSASCVQRVVVQDATPPHIASIVATPNVLWPPNHRMVQVNLMLDATDNCDPSPVVRITEVRCNEPQNPSAPDWEIKGPQSVNLRAERFGKGEGRTYTVVVQCEDASGNVSQASVDVTVPHNVE